MKPRPSISTRRRPAQLPALTVPESNQLRAAGVEASPSSPTSAAANAPRTGEQPAIPETLPILPMRNTVVFPGMVVPLTIGRASSRKLLEDSFAQSKIIGVFTQKDPKQDEPAPEDLHRVGVAVTVLKLIRSADEQAVVVVQALERMAIRKVLLTHPFIRAEVDVLASTAPPADDKQFEAAVRGLRESASKLLELSGEEAEAARLTVLNIDEPGLLADFLAGTLNLETQQKLELLEELDVVKRVRAVHRSVSAQLEIARIQQKIQKDVSSSFGDQQRRAYLREQVKAIHKELGEGEEGVEQQIEELRKRLNEAQLPKEVMEQAERELRRLRHLHPASPEYSVIVSYVEMLAELPWDKLTQDNLDLDRAQKILDRDHFDLEKVKRRLILAAALEKSASTKSAS